MTPETSELPAKGKVTLEAEELKELLLNSLERQGFRMKGDIGLELPKAVDKEALRRLHAHAVSHRIKLARPGLRRHETRLLSYIASGSEVFPERIVPRVVEVKPESNDELLFRYARLHWSIPISAGYGRRLRFVIYDESNGKLMGIIGLSDPVFSLAPRDRWIGWTRDERQAKLRYVMDAFVLGAVPPYSYLLCAKLIALLTTSNEVRQTFSQKYVEQRSIITGEPIDGYLALITTTSALGRSSIYNRLRFRGTPAFVSAGFTSGSGDFHFANGLYAELRQFAMTHCRPTAKHGRWGTGFRNRRELVRKVLPLLGLSPKLLYHGVQREIFVAPLAQNATAFLCGRQQQLRWHDRPTSDLFAWFRERWLLPRAARDARYKAFNAASYRLWDGDKYH